MPNRQTTTQRNKEYHAARAAERERRRAAGLTFVSKHDQRDHFVTQQEFIRWMNETFGRGCNPMWQSGTSSPHFTGIHHNWLLQTQQQIVMAKLRWS